MRKFIILSKNNQPTFINFTTVAMIALINDRTTLFSFVLKENISNISAYNNTDLSLSLLKNDLDTPFNVLTNIVMSDTDPINSRFIELTAIKCRNNESFKLYDECKVLINLDLVRSIEPVDKNDFAKHGSYVYFASSERFIHVQDAFDMILANIDKW